MKRTILIILACLAIGAGAAVIALVAGKQETSGGISLITGNAREHDMDVIYINAGKADSMLLKIDGQAFLIDTGLKKSVKMIKKVLGKYGVSSLEAVFLSHRHSDHVGGLEKIAKSYPIKKLYSPAISNCSEEAENSIDRKADELNISLKKLSAGDRVPLVEDVTMEVLGPLEENKEDDNDNSLVLRIFVNKRVFLFTGDMQFSEEKTLLDAGVDVSADIYKVGNHGNPDATSEKFAKAVSPEIAIITTDTEKDQDSANKRVISSFKKAKVLLTQDYDLGIRITVDGNGKIAAGQA
ncbi:ComEC/Rec2 family competence protein [[Clostridium] polysaccharolyticum]|nr:MBL fold metallo-hydrolase [[Clostridium] polysaccharolyticum]